MQELVSRAPFATTFYPNWRQIRDVMRREFAERREVYERRRDEEVAQLLASDRPDRDARIGQLEKTDPFRDEATFHRMVREILDSHPDLDVAEAERPRLAMYLYQELYGFGPMSVLLADEKVEDVMLDRYDRLYVMREGQIVRIRPSPFGDDREVFNYLQTVIFTPAGKELNQAQPFQNASLHQDGELIGRIIAFREPGANATGFVIRRHRKEVFKTAEDYMATGVAPDEFFADLYRWVREQRNIVVSGATGSGKTTFLNFAAAMVQPEHRILTLEDTPELMIQHPKVLSWKTVEQAARAGDSKDDLAITMRDLVRSSLRATPTRIVVGEVRDAEAFDMLKVLNTGHPGSFVTLHSNSTIDAINRLQEMAIMASVEYPLANLQNMIASVIDIVVQIRRVGSHRRVIGADQVMYSKHYDQDIAGMQGVRHLEGNVYLRRLWSWDRDAATLRRVAEYLPAEHDV